MATIASSKRVARRTDRAYARRNFDAGRHLAVQAPFVRSDAGRAHGAVLCRGGASFAADATKSAVKLVTGKNVKNSSLTGKDIKNSSLTTSDVKNRSLRAADFKAGQLPAGAPGPAGANGRDGSAGTARAYGQVSGAGVLDPAVRKNATVTKTSTGIYCIKLDPSIDASTTAASASLALGSDVKAKLRSIPKNQAGTCDLEPNAVAIQTFDTDGTTTTSNDEPFFFLVP